MKRISLTLIALITLLFTLAAVAQPRPRGAEGPGPGHGPRRGMSPEALAELLDLSEAQKSQAEALRATQREAIAPLREQARANHEAIRAAVEAGNATAAGEKLIANDKLRDQMKAEHDKFKAAFESMLTADQKAKFAVFQELQDLRRPGRERPEP